MRAPLARISSTRAVCSSTVSERYSAGLQPAMRRPGSFSVSRCCKLVEQLFVGAEEEDRHALRGGAAADFEHHLWAVHALAKLRTVNEVEGPADGLAVGNHEVERVEPVAVRFVADADHHTVDGDGGHGERLAVVRGADDFIDGGLVIDCVDADTRDVVFASINHPTVPPIVAIDSSAVSYVGALI